jgi:hypothetical protein
LTVAVDALGVHLAAIENEYVRIVGASVGPVVHVEQIAEE